MNTQFDMVSHDLYRFLYNSNQTIHKTPIETVSDNNVSTSYNSNYSKTSPFGLSRKIVLNSGYFLLFCFVINI